MVGGIILPIRAFSSRGGGFEFFGPGMGWRRFDPSSSPSASLPQVVCFPRDLVGN
jgi:hypothetical protein